MKAQRRTSRHEVRNVFQALFFSCKTTRDFLGGNGEGGIPEPIPNSEVKPLIADGTIHKSMEE